MGSEDLSLHPALLPVDLDQPPFPHVGAGADSSWSGCLLGGKTREAMWSLECRALIKAKIPLQSLSPDRQVRDLHSSPGFQAPHLFRLQFPI